MILSQLRGRDATVAACRAYNLHPVTLYTYLLPLSMLMTGLIRPEFPDLPGPPILGHLVTTAKVAVFWLISWTCLGHVAWFTMRRGLPFFLAPILLWSVAVLGSQAVSALLFAGVDWSTTRVLRQAALTLPSTAVCVYAAAPMLRERLGEIPDLVPIWSFNRKVAVPLLLRLPAARRGRLMRIHAANQYVEVVTDKGTSLLRMPLRDAVALVPAEMGWLCHRSLWIRREDAVSLTYQRGQPQLLDREGQVWPVSRAAAPDIRRWLRESRDDPGNKNPADEQEAMVTNA